MANSDNINNIDFGSIFVYQVALPGNVREAVTPCADGYTVYINENLSFEQRQKAFIHALRHISGSDFDKANVQTIETDTHN